MKNKVTIMQIIVTEIEVEAPTLEKAREEAERIVEKNMIPISEYELVEATFSASTVQGKSIS